MAEETKKTISPNEAVKAAVEYFRSVVMPVDEASQVSIEGIELSSDKANWLITLGHRDPTTPSIYTLYPGSSSKVYKLFTINSEDGSVMSMKATKI